MLLKRYRNWVKTLLSSQLLWEFGYVDVNDKLNPILMKRRIFFLLFPLSLYPGYQHHKTMWF